MSQQVLVVGIGPGEKEYLLPIAQEKVAAAQVLVGGRRALDLLARKDQEVREIKGSLQEIINFIREKKEAKRVAVLLSGDPGLYGMLNFLLKNFPPEELEVIPGISSMQMCFARLKLPWQDIKIVSLHGRSKDQLLNWVRQYPQVAFFTDDKFPPQDVGAFLQENGIKNKRVIVGENLSYPEERIVDTDLEGIANYNNFTNCVMLILSLEEKKAKQAIAWDFTTPGIPDQYFVRGKVPMTKEEVRAVTLGKARLRKDSVVYDVGAGTGSISIEAAFLAPWGRVVAMEKNPEGISLIKENQERFGVTNLEIMEGDASLILADLPPAHRIIIGGSGGFLKKILQLSKEKLLPEGRVVLNCIALESLFNSLEILEKLGFQEIEVSQVSVARAEKVAGLRMMKGLNPIYIVAAEKGDNQ